MKVLFLTLIDFSSIDEMGIYTDLMREFVKNNHNVYIISPTEKKTSASYSYINKDRYVILKIKIGITQKTNKIRKTISTVCMENKYKIAIQKYFRNIKFDLVIYSTPPITLQKAVKYIKKRDDAKSYLLLKDIFPQNAVDLGILKKNGIYAPIYQYFRYKEKKLYNTSDYIGCMSKANVEYVLKNNPEIKPNIVEVCPNTIELIETSNDSFTINEIKSKYNIPVDKTIFIYGGNIGKPQGIDFIINCLEANYNNKKVHFVIVGSGTEYSKLKSFIEDKKLTNVQIFDQIPRKDYDDLVNSCDVGLIFLDKRFTIPNFPSRLLSYMLASKPVLAATDINTDIGQVIIDGKFGLWCESDDITKFNQNLLELCNKDIRKEMGQNARRYLEKHYTARNSYEIIMKHFYF